MPQTTAISEESLKFNVYETYFKKCKYIPDFHKIDIALEYKEHHILWAEAKNKPTDIYKMFAQLIFTIYKVQKEHFTPQYISVFDTEKIAFIPFDAIATLYNEQKNVDFDWTVTPSNHNTKEFKIIANIIKNAIEAKNILYENETENLHDLKQLVFYFKRDDEALKKWINTNIITETPIGPLKITDENFHKVYSAWRDDVKKSIRMDWDAIKNDWNILDCDFFLADLFADDNYTLTEKLFVLLKSSKYKIIKESQTEQYGFINDLTAEFNDKQVAHKQFWNKYKRPPEEQYWDLILKRRDLLVPSDIRERLGAFFTPPEWVALAQKYMADVWGDNISGNTSGDISDKYYIWDCAGGTGNLLQGLNNPANLFASDINIENVYVMHGRIAEGTLNMLENHCFRFDFLNDELWEGQYGKKNSTVKPKDILSLQNKLPDKLLSIIKNEPEKLIIFINPPYAEATSTATKIGTKENKTGVTTKHNIHIKYSDKLGKARQELFALFLIRIHEEINGCKIGTFSTLKGISSPNFKSFRQFFLAKFEKGFIVPANTFDNVDGQFPIAFQCWNTSIKAKIKNCKFDVYKFKKENKKIEYIGKKKVYNYNDTLFINDWIKNDQDTDNINVISAKLCYVGNDFQNQNKVQICSQDKNIIAHDVAFNITRNNLIPACIYFTVRKVIPADWLNDRDQFLYPVDGWQKDLEFQNDCLTYTLFHNANNIQSKFGINHWIPFNEKEVGVKEAFVSHFMLDFIAGKIKVDNGNGIYNNGKIALPKREFSAEATTVFDAGRELYRYYHKQFNSNPNASFYDIREYFQGRDNGRMNSKSNDETYNELITNLRAELKNLAQKIEPKIYEYVFLKK